MSKFDTLYNSLINEDKKEIYKGWKSGMKSTGWKSVVDGRDINDKANYHFHEIKTVGPVTVERFQYPFRNELYWLVNGKRFAKLKEAVAYADTLMLKAGYVLAR